MQSSKDLAALALLILLALTVRVDLHGRTVDLDVSPDAEAAFDDPSSPQVAGPPTVSGWFAIEKQANPAGTPSPVESLPGIAGSLAEVALPRADAVAEKLGQIEQRKLVWEIDGKRVILFIREGPGEAVSPDSPESCTTSIDPHLSC